MQWENVSYATCKQQKMQVSLHIWTVWSAIIILCLDSVIIVAISNFSSSLSQPVWVLPGHTTLKTGFLMTWLKILSTVILYPLIW